MKKFSLEVLLLLTLVMVSHAVQLNNRWGFKSSHSLLNPNFIHNKFLIKNQETIKVLNSFQNSFFLFTSANISSKLKVLKTVAIRPFI